MRISGVKRHVECVNMKIVLSEINNGVWELRYCVITKNEVNFIEKENHIILQERRGAGEYVTIMNIMKDWKVEVLL